MPNTPDLILTPFAQNGNWTQPPQTSSTNFVNFTTGYTPDYEISLTAGNPAAKAVDRPTQNYLFYQSQLHAQNWQQMSAPPWFAAMPGGYAQNAVVIRQNAQSVWVPYRSLVNNNVTDPLTGTTSWEYIPYAHEAKANIPMPQGGANGTSSAALVTVATDFNTFTTSGTWEFQSDTVASGSSNAPAEIGGSTVAGMLEVMAWNNGTSNVVVQRYLDRNGNAMLRGSVGGAWTAWRNVSNAQQPTIYGTETINGTVFGGQALIVSDPNNTGAGAGIKLMGDGSTTPNKIIRSAGGYFQVVNSGNTAVIMGLDDSGNLSASNSVTSKGIDNAGNGGSFRSVYANYGVFFRNDGSNFFALQTNSGDQYGTYNSYRPFYWNLNNGAVTIDGTGVGTNFGGAIYTGPATINGTGVASSNTLTVSDPNNTAGARIRLVGNGTTTPNKYISAEGGAFHVTNSTDSQYTLSSYDNGDLGIPGTIYVNGNISFSSTTGIFWQNSNSAIYQDASGNGPGDVVIRSGTGANNYYNVFRNDGAAIFATGIVVPNLVYTQGVQNASNVLLLESNQYVAATNTANNAYVPIYAGASTNPQSCVTYGQMQTPIGSVASGTINNSCGTVTASFYAPGPGTLFAFGSRVNSTLASYGSQATLYINGTLLANDNTETSLTHVATVTTPGYGTVTASFYACCAVAASLYVMLVWIPTI